MPDGLYEHDALAWAEQQADLLRRLAAGERLNAAVDWPNVIEEVQDVGLSELRSCRSLLRQALVHLLKLHAWPGSQASAHWRDEVAGFLDDARDRFSPSMRQRLDLDDLYADASDRVRVGTDDAGEPRPLPETCPFALDELLTKRRDVAALAAKLSRTGETEGR
ncbi:MAG: DUF29 domain-containing protein [Pseudomonadota bacterium]|nr:DUF29 domain-containing protein [Pseudomonadota bacterium]